MRRVILLFGIAISMLLLAGCSTEFIVEFETNGGESVESIAIKQGETTELPVPLKEGHTFMGWFTGDGPNDTQFSNSTPVTRDINLYARWQINEYTVTFNYAGGYPISVNNYEFDQSIDIPPNPFREGYTFTGWDLEIPRQMPAENLILNSEWEINEYNLIFNTYQYSDPSTDIILEKEETILDISGESNSVFIITSKGRVLSSGANQFGQLGDGTTSDRSSFLDITSNFNLDEDETIIDISSSTHTLAITSKGRVFSWGFNIFGQLGIETPYVSTLPIDITDQFNFQEDETLVNISTGGNASSALTSKDRVLVWGDNKYGQLGDGTTTDRNIPTEITSQFDLNNNEVVVDIKIGIALTSMDRVFTWGDNIYGDLGIGSKDDIGYSNPIDITQNFNLNSGENINKISSGSFNAVLTSENRIFTWGQSSTVSLIDYFDKEFTDNINYPNDITSRYDFAVGDTIKIIKSNHHNNLITVTSFGKVYMNFGDNTQLFNLNEDEKIISYVNLFQGPDMILTSQNRLLVSGGDELNIIEPYSTNVSIHKFNEPLNEYHPEREGYAFDGWYLDSALTIPFDITFMPSNNLTLFGRWLPE